MRLVVLHRMYLLLKTSSRSFSRLFLFSISLLLKSCLCKILVKRLKSLGFWVETLVIRPRDFAFKSRQVSFHITDRSLDWAATNLFLKWCINSSPNTVPNPKRKKNSKGGLFLDICIPLEAKNLSDVSMCMYVRSFRIEYSLRDRIKSHEY